MPVIIELANYIKPKIVEDGHREWVLNGRNNSFFQYVIDRYNGSPTNAALVDAYIDRIYGQGISLVNAKNNATEYAQLLSIVPRKELRKIVSDFKLFGSAVGQVRYAKGSKRRIAKIEHIERKAVAPEKINAEGEIDGFYVCFDWSKITQNEPVRYPKFGTSKEDVEIFEIKPYKAGKTYFADPSYLASLQYAKLEEEIANFSVSHIQNGLSAGYIINFNNGQPASEEQAEEIERQVNGKLGGSQNAGKIIISFNDNKETAPTVEAIPTNANHEQWQFWADEARRQILVGHRVTTPMLFGVKDNTGLGNNANEMAEGNKFLEKYSIGPAQREIIDVLESIVQVNEIASPLMFIPLDDEEDVKEDLGVDKKEIAQPKENVQMSKQMMLCADELILTGEDIEQDGWECIITEEVDYETEETKDALLQLATTGTARPNANSEQDSNQFKIRYQYAPLNASADSREFCKKMVSVEKVYRKEDIIMMGALPVNDGFGIAGASTYSIWLYKGGAQCHHKWLRKTYVKKGANVDVNSPLAQIISTAEARRRGDRTRNEREVSIRPIDMPNKGFYTPR